MFSLTSVTAVLSDGAAAAASGYVTALKAAQLPLLERQRGLLEMAGLEKAFRRSGWERRWPRAASPSRRGEAETAAAVAG